MRKYILKYWLLVLCLFVEVVNLNQILLKKNKLERTDTTDDIIDDQMEIIDKKCNNN
jgi:hypothetical protein